MTDLYQRILLWHKLVAMQTGGLALCSAKRRLNRDEATGWASTLENVAADIRQFLNNGTFALDDQGQRMVQSVTASPDSVVKQRQETAHEVQVARKSPNPEQQVSSGRAVDRKVGGPRLAARRKT